MKNKKLIILLSIFFLLILIVILCSTIFTVQTYSLNWVTLYRDQYTDVKDDFIVEDLKTGQSIFLFDKNEQINILEQKYPYIQVVGIESKFPNKMIIHVIERQPMYAVKLTDELYSILDSQAKVLYNYQASVLKPVTDLNLIELNVQGYSLEDKQDQFKIGQIIDIPRVNNVIESMTFACKVKDYKNNFIKDTFDDMDLLVNYSGQLTIDVKSGVGYTIIIKDPVQSLSNKLVYAFDVLEQEISDGTLTAQIKVFIDSNGKLIADVG